MVPPPPTVGLGKWVELMVAGPLSSIVPPVSVVVPEKKLSPSTVCVPVMVMVELPVTLPVATVLPPAEKTPTLPAPTSAVKAPATPAGSASQNVLVPFHAPVAEVVLDPPAVAPLMSQYKLAACATGAMPNMAGVAATAARRMFLE